MRNRIPAHCSTCCAHVNTTSGHGRRACADCDQSACTGLTRTVNSSLICEVREASNGWLVGRVPPMGNGEGFKGRVTRQSEEALGKLAQDVLENPVVTGALSRVFETRERAMRAQEVAMGALTFPSASDLERLTRRVRSVSQRLEGIEDGVDRLDDRLQRPAANHSLEERLASIERTLERLEAAQAAVAADAAKAAAGRRAAPRSRARAKPATRKTAPAAENASAAPDAQPQAAGDGSGAPAASRRPLSRHRLPSPQADRARTASSPSRCSPARRRSGVTRSRLASAPIRSATRSTAAALSPRR